MQEQKLFSVGTPLIYIATIDANAFANLSLRLAQNNKAAIVRTVRGRKSKTVLEFFDEISAALQFPYYFGENGAAFDECINDLDWIEGDAYLITISEADLFLASASSDEFRGVTEILINANLEWMNPNQYSSRQRRPTAFHILCQCENENSEFLKRLHECGFEFEIL